MKKILVITAFLLSSYIHAFTCNWGGNFIRVSKYAKTLVKAEVIEHFYHTANGKRFTDKEEFIREKEKFGFDSNYETGQSVQIEIISLIKGEEKRKVIEIFDSDGADCRANVSHFKKGKTYLLIIHKTGSRYYRLPNETKDDYKVYNCAENWVEYDPVTNKVSGMIVGKSYNRKKRWYKYDKLLRKIRK